MREQVRSDATRERHLVHRETHASTRLEDSLKITEQALEKAYVIVLSGQLDSDTSRKLEDVLCPRMEASQDVVVDMCDVAYVSSAGLRIFLKAAKIARAASHRLVLAGLAPQVKEVFDISGFTNIFRIAPDVPAALRTLG